MMIRAHAAKPSRGMTVVAVLVCLIIVTLISGAVLKVGLAQRDLARSFERRLQAEWLAESGVERALARLAGDRDYTGETWTVSALDLGQNAAVTAGADKPDSAAAVITIAVERVPANSSRRRVKVQADYPRDPPRRSRHTKQVTIDLEPGQTGAAP
jgi:Tfp pilus assembly protein PilV